MNEFQPLNTQVLPYKGKPAIHLNGKAVPPLIYALTSCPGGRFSWNEVPSVSISQFAAIGFKLYQFDVDFNDLWLSEDNFSIQPAQMQIRGVLAHSPDAAVIFRLHCNPPFWWLKANPDEWVRYADCEVTPQPPRPAFEGWMDHDQKPYCRNSYASERWLAVMGGMVKRFCEEFAATPEGNHLAGIQIANGIYGENHYWCFVHHDPDVSEPMQRYFRTWLKNKYHTDSALAQAWGQPQATLENVQVPGLERNNPHAGMFYDPATQRNIIDYFECQHSSVTKSLLYFARIIKETWPRKIITGAFYGYYLSLFGRQATGGHLLEQEILSSPDIDFLCAPQAYSDNCRQLGGPGLSRGLIESVTAHGKLWLDEHDQPTHYGTGLGGMITYDKPQSIQNNRKCVLEPFIRGGGLWYYDFGRWFSSGWWSDPEYMADIEKLTRIMERHFEQEFQSPADVLLVLDTRVFLQTGNSTALDPITVALSVDLTVPNAYMSGASVATCYLSDLERMNLSQFKVIIFANCFAISQDEITRIRALTACDGRHIVWMTAPGYLDGQGFNSAAVSQASGIQLEPVTAVGLPEIEISAPGFPNLRTGGMPMLQRASAKVFGEGKSSYEVQNTFFAIDDTDATIIGRFAESGKAAAGYKTNHDNTDWFFALPVIDAVMLQAVFRKAGAHIYNDAHDSTLCGAGLLEVHTKDGGLRLLTLRNGKSITINLAPSATAVFDDQSGEQLL